MKKLTLLTILAVLIGATAQAQRSVPPKKSFEDYRPDGEMRVWTFMKKDSTIGRLTSVVQGVAEIAGADAHRIHEQLLLDYTKAEGDLKLQVVGDCFFTETGAFAGCDISRKARDQAGRVILERRGDSLGGFLERGKQRAPASIAFPPGGFAIGYDMPDQYELYFAMHGVKVGDVINDSVFVPSDLGVTYLRGTVTGWTWQQLWKGVYDSVFVVEMTEPVPQELFINRDLHLRKINIPSQKMRVYLDLVREQPKPAEPEKPTVSFSAANFTRNLIIYVLVGLVGLALFAGRMFRRAAPYVALVAGAAVTVLVLMGVSMFNYRQGSAWIIYLLLYLPSVLFYALGLVVLWLAGRGFSLTGRQLMAAGAAIGAGIGIAMGSYVDVVASPDQTLAFGQVLNILLYVGGGALLGWAWNRSRAVVAGVYVAVCAVSALLTTLRLLYTGPNPELHTLFVGIAAAILLLAAVLAGRRPTDN